MDTKEKIKKARELIDDINEWSKTKVLLGIEADIISDDGTLDVDNETLAMLDILIISYHRMTFTNFANYFGFAKKTKEAKQRCTNAFINAIKSPKGFNFKFLTPFSVSNDIPTMLITKPI